MLFNDCVICLRGDDKHQTCVYKVIVISTCECILHQLSSIALNKFQKTLVVSPSLCLLCLYQLLQTIDLDAFLKHKLSYELQSIHILTNYKLKQMRILVIENI